MDGQVPGDTNYQEWFSRQSFDRQKQIVGESVRGLFVMAACRRMILTPTEANG
jgi:hypothetical protein